MKYILMRGWATQAKFVKPFILQFCIFYVNWGKNMNTFTNLGEKICISTPFFIPFQSFFFLQTVIWPYFCPHPAQRNIHPWSGVRSRSRSEPGVFGSLEQELLEEKKQEPEPLGKKSPEPKKNSWLFSPARR